MPAGTPKKKTLKRTPKYQRVKAAKLSALRSLPPDRQRFIEGYATALKDLEQRLTGDNGCSKSYDPMTCEEKVMHSYAFDMKDGGRHHPVADYGSVEEILSTLLGETASSLSQQAVLEIENRWSDVL
jgi:hypothetical protein